MRALMTHGAPLVGMVRSRSTRPRRRNRNAGPERRRDEPATAAPEAPGAIDERKHPNLAAQREMDRLLHVRQARQLGLTRKQASRHADEHLRDE